MDGEIGDVFRHKNGLYARECLSLPIYPEMTDAQIERTATVVKAFFGK